MGNRTALKDAWSKAVTRANVTLAVGFGCAVSISPTLLTAATPDNMMSALVNKPPHGACMPSLVAAALACLVIFLGGRRLFAVLERTVKPLALGVAMALMGAVLVLPLVTRNSVSVTGDVVIAVAGSLSVLLYLFWMQLFGRLSAQSMFLTLFLSQVLTCAINAIISIANIYTVVATSIALPLVSTICLRVGQREHADERPSSEVPASQEGHGASTLMLVKLAAIVFAWGVIDHLFRSEFDAFMRTQVTTSPFAVAYHAAAFVVVVAAVAFAYALLAYRERFQFGHLYRMIFLLGLASILLLPIVLAGQATIVGYTCSVIMYQLVFLLVWVIAASVFRDSPTHAPGFFGLVYGFWSLGSLGGALFSSVFVQHLTMDNVHLIVFAAVLAVAVGYAVMFTEADANALVQIVPYKRKAPFKAKCQAVAQEYQLSPRETEIAMLIAQGRDSAHIEKKLFLSRSTVQTHRMHLYQRLDIHNRQERAPPLFPYDAFRAEGSAERSAAAQDEETEGRRPMHAQRRIALVTVCALLGTVGIAGCAPQANEALATDDRQAAQAEERNYTDEQKSIIAGEEGTTYDGISLDAYPGKGYLDDMHDMWDANVDQWAPELRTLPSGQIVQRTPSELTERARQGKTG